MCDKMQNFNFKKGNSKKYKEVKFERVNFDLKTGTSLPQ